MVVLMLLFPESKAAVFASLYTPWNFSIDIDEDYRMTKPYFASPTAHYVICYIYYFHVFDVLDRIGFMILERRLKVFGRPVSVPYIRQLVHFAVLLDLYELSKD